MVVGTDRYTYATVNAAGTTNVTGKPVILHAINIMDPVAATLTICDGTAAASGTVAEINAGSLGSYRFDVELGSGLKIVSDGNIKACIVYTEF